MNKIIKINLLVAATLISTFSAYAQSVQNSQYSISDADEVSDSQQVELTAQRGYTEGNDLQHDELSVKHALIIAIGEYPVESGWGSLSSANDLVLMKGTLIKQGFQEKNIIVLTDQDATKMNIVTKLQDLTRKVKQGDMVVIHFSGHGQQISDDNGDEIDNLDECLVPYDVENVTGENHIRDDLLGKLINDLRRKLGKAGHVIIFLDSCHSGTATRGTKKIRGGREPLIIAGAEQNKSGEMGKETGSGLFESGPKSRGTNTELASFVLFAASNSNESNFEAYDENYKPVGSLSYALSKAFSELNGPTSYRGLFAKVMTTMAQIVPYQTPVAEGDIDNEVFNGNTISQMPYFNIIEFVNENVLKIDGGAISGIMQGDLIGLYNSGTANTRNLTADNTGKVMMVDNFSAEIIFNKPHEVYNLKSKWAFVTEKNYAGASYSLRVHINVQNNGLKTQIEKALKDLSLVDISAKNAELVIEETTAKGSRGIFIKTAGENMKVNEKPIMINGPADIDKCIDIIKQYAQSKFIKKISMTDKNYNAELELIPVKVDNEGKITDTLDMKDFMENGTIPRFRVGDKALIRFKNTGDKDCYVSVIDIQPNGIINPILPDGKKFKDGKELKIKKGQTLIIPDLWVSLYEPCGTEVFKVFITEQPLNLQPIISSRGSSTRGASHPMEKLFQSSYQNTRGAKPESMPSGSSGSTFDYVFKIAPK